MTTILAVHDVTKSYRRGHLVNDRVTLSAEAGQVYGVLGHNGARKTTLVHQIVGLLRPDHGSNAIHGHDIVADPAYARRVCSTEPQSQVPINGMTPRQAIGLVGRERLPDWLATIHSVLPIQAMGEVIRGTLAGNVFPLTIGPFLLLGTWCIAAFAITGRVMTRRG